MVIMDERIRWLSAGGSSLIDRIVLDRTQAGKLVIPTCPSARTASGSSRHGQRRR